MLNKKNIKKFLIIVFCVLLIMPFFIMIPVIRLGSFSLNEWQPTNQFNINNISSVQLKDDGTFKLLQITDLHLTSFGFVSRPQTFQFVRELINKLKPDAVCASGDLVISLFNRELLNEFATFMDEEKMPWYYVLGNHDYQFGSGAYRLLNILKNYNYARFELGPTNIGGYGNSFITINKGTEIMHSICFMDTSSYKTTSLQAEWYKWNLRGIDASAGKKVNNLLMMHIPMQIVKQNVPNSIINENVNVLKEEPGLYDAVSACKNTSLVVNGHDHLNSFSIQIDGINFISTPSTGFCGYGTKNVDRGALLITFTEENITTKLYTASEFGWGIKGGFYGKVTAS